MLSKAQATFIAAPMFSAPATRLRIVFVGPGAKAWQCAGAFESLL